MNKPPKSADLFLSWFCRDELVEEVRGDLHEYFGIITEDHGRFKSYCLYWFHVLHFLRPFAFKKINNRSTQYIMLKNNIKISWRNMVKHKGFSSIHLFGLAMGIASSLFIMAYVLEEMKVDQAHRQKGQVHRVNSAMDTGESIMQVSVASGALGPAMLNDFPEVGAYLRLSRPWSPLLVKNDQQRHFESKAIYADPDFFKFFDFDLQSGSTHGALEGPGKVVLTQSLANRYFGKENAIGRQLLIKDLPYQVTAVLKEEQSPSHLDFDMLISFASWTREYTATETNWGWFPTNTYVLLNPNADVAHLEAQLPGFVEHYMPASEQTPQIALSLTPLSDLYFEAPRLGDIGHSGNLKQLYLLLSAALLIMILAISNFINLSSARAAERMKEVGVRKVVGAHRRQLTYQFFTESVLYSLLSTVMAIGLVYLLWSPFLNLVGQEISIQAFLTPQNLTVLLAISFLVGVLAGAYPALLMSSFKPVDALKSRSLGAMRVFSARKVMLTVQFFISIGLLIISMTMWKQFLHMEKRDLGFYKGQTLVVNLDQNQEILRKYQVIKNELLSTGYLSGVSFSSHVPGDKPHSISTMLTHEGESMNAEIWLNLVDHDFIDNYGLELQAGRSFSNDISADTTGSVILNEAALKTFGITEPEEALGLNISQWGRQGKVVGVIKDFHQESLHSKISPMSFQVWPGQFQKVSMKIGSEDLAAALAQIARVWADQTGSPFNYAFLDDQLGKLYANDQRFGKIFRLFTLLSISITFLGLVSFSTFMVRLKMKEMAIRKILGALSAELIWLLVRQFWVPALIALLVSSIPAYLFLSDWLSQFAYQIQIGVSSLLLPVVILMAIVMTTVSLQGLGAIRENPVKHLRNE